VNTKAPNDISDEVPIRHVTQLLVEGKDLWNVAIAHLNSLGRHDVDVHDFGGVDQLADFLAGFVAHPRFFSVISIGIIRDAEESARAAWQSVQSACREVGLSDSQGLGTGPAVSVFILPDGKESGMLETLLWATIRCSPEADCVEDFLACVDRIPGRTTKRRDKARLHAWIASQAQPGVSVGVAALKKYLPLQHPALEGFRTFLRNL